MEVVVWATYLQNNLTSSSQVVRLAEALESNKRKCLKKVKPHECMKNLKFE